jgi:carboxypeptidase Taq
LQDLLSTFKARMTRVTNLMTSASLLSWDQETMMPPGGAAVRAEQISTLQGLAHEFITAGETGQMLEQLRPLADELPYDDDDAALIRFATREYNRRTRIPTALVVEIYRTAGLAKEAWKEARATGSFAVFEPLLSKMVDLQIQKAECFKPYKNPYDALLDDFEPGLDYEYINGVFVGLRPRLIEIVRAIAANQDAVDAGVIRRRVSQEQQLAFGREVAAAIGYDFQRGRLDLSAHPFTSGAGPGDMRITTRVMPDNPISCLMAVIHEAGHGMHGQNISPDLIGTPMGMFSTLAIAESQSRFWENVIGRSRAFWRFFYPKLQAAFAPVFDDLDEETFYRALNESRPSLIRVEADEVTYGLHIMLRFEIENELINGRLAVSDLPEAWNARMDAYLGVVPPGDSVGVLQDIHWSQGGFGYFPDYLLGSIFASQLWEKLSAGQPAVEDQIAAGQFGDVLAWTAGNVMQHARKYTFPELADRVTGGFSADPYIVYLSGKYGAIYSF